MRSEFNFPLRLGFGCSGAVGASWHPPEEARRVLLAALEGGVRHFDTAGFYARGEAERRLGLALCEFGEPVFVSTKTGTRYDGFGRASKDFSDAAIRRDVEESLKRLKRARIDLVYLHGPTADEERSGLETLGRLKEEGKIARAGLCGEGEGLARAATADGVDVIMGVYNFMRRAHAPAFAAAKARGRGVVAIAPLAQGLYDPALLRPMSPAALWKLARALLRNPSEMRAIGTYRALLAGVPDCTPAQVALAFSLANSAVDVALTTTTRLDHLAETLRAAARPATPALLAQLARLDAAGSGA